MSHARGGHSPPPSDLAPSAAMEMPPRAVRAPTPPSVPPMRAVLGEPFTDPAYTFELKYDGMRALAYGQDDHLRIVTRLGNSVTAQFPELEGLSDGMRARSWIVDGEIAALDDAGVSRFDLLAPRIHAKGAATVRRLARTRPIVYYLFDLLYLEGHDLRAVALEDRRALLRSVLVPRGGGALARRQRVRAFS